MYAVICTGGKQARVDEGATLEVELLDGEEGSEISFAPILVVDGSKIAYGQDAAKTKVVAKILGETKGPKIRGFKYKCKTNQRRRFGHRQHYTKIEITKITKA